MPAGYLEFSSSACRGMLFLSAHEQRVEYRREVGAGLAHERAVSKRAVSKRAVSERAVSERAVSERAVSKRAAGAEEEEAKAQGGGRAGCAGPVRTARARRERLRASALPVALPARPRARPPGR